MSTLQTLAATEKRLQNSIIEIVALREKISQKAAELEAMQKEREELKQAVVLAFRAIEEVGFTDMGKAVKALDHYLANDLSDKLWEEINTAALDALKAEEK